MVKVFDVILSTDRSLMTNHHGKQFLGFGTTMPVILPRKFIEWLFCPPMKNKEGIVWQAPYGLRRVEARLVHDGIKAAVIDPSNVKDYLEAGAKVLVIRHHDWFGLNPPTTWTTFFDKDPINVILFREFMEEVIKARTTRDFKALVIGPAVWVHLFICLYMILYVRSSVHFWLSRSVGFHPSLRERSGGTHKPPTSSLKHVSICL